MHSKAETRRNLPVPQKNDGTVLEDASSSAICGLSSKRCTKAPWRPGIASNHKITNLNSKKISTSHPLANESCRLRRPSRHSLEWDDARNGVSFMTIQESVPIIAELAVPERSPQVLAVALLQHPPHLFQRRPRAPFQEASHGAGHPRRGEAVSPEVPLPGQSGQFPRKA